MTEEEKAAKKLKREEEDKARAAKRAEEEKTRDARTVFVSQLQVRATEKDIKKFFEKMAGKVCIGVSFIDCDALKIGCVYVNSTCVCV